MRTFSILFVAAFVASASAQQPVCEDQPLYEGDCPQFTDEDCSEEGKRYRVACELNENISDALHLFTIALCPPHTISRGVAFQYRNSQLNLQ